MTTYEKCQTIRRILINRTAEVMAYSSWPDKFAAKEIRNLPEDIKEMKGGKKLFGILPAELTHEEMVSLGFRRWSDESDMMLIPLWLFPFLADVFEAGCIDGETRIFKKADMDNDNRGGCLAYGVMPQTVASNEENSE